METEDWLPVDGYGGAYHISNLGNVRSFQGRQAFMMRLSTTPHGAHVVKLYQYGFGTTHRVSKLVWQAFRGKPAPALFHRDGNLKNNALSNLTTERNV